MAILSDFDIARILMDVEMPVQDGVTTTLGILGKYQNQKVTIISQHDDPWFQRNATRADTKNPL